MPRARCSPPRRRGQHGQATIEYAGVLVVMAVVLVVAIGAAHAAGLTNAVVREFKRGLCIVTGHGCQTLDLKACAVRTRDVGVTLTAKVAIVSVGRKATLAVLRKSDGTVDVIELDERKLGVTGGIGAQGHLDLGGSSVGGGVSASAEAAAALAVKRLWHVEDMDAANDLVHQLAKDLAVDTGTRAIPVVGPLLGGVVKKGANALGLGGGVRRPDLEGVEGGLKGTAELKLPRGKLGVDVSAAISGTRDRTTGIKTVAFALDHSLAASLELAAAGGKLAGGATGVMQVSWDRDNRLSTLRVLLIGDASSTLSADLETARGRTGKPNDARGQRLQVAATLDLTVPANRAALDRVLAGMDPRGLGRDLPAAVVALGGRLAADGLVDVARYGTSKWGIGGGAEAALGLKVGGELSVSDERTHLLDAWSRPPGGLWERRLDCVG